MDLSQSDYQAMCAGLQRHGIVLRYTYLATEGRIVWCVILHGKLLDRFPDRTAAMAFAQRYAAQLPPLTQRYIP